MNGIEFKNGNNSLILMEGELPLQYWGKITLTTNNNTVHHSIFNLPDSVVCRIYTVINSGLRTNILRLFTDNGRWKVVAKTNDVTTFDIYVFTEPKIMPKSTFGIELYGDAGQTIFNGSRPLLSLYKVANCFIDPALTNNNYSGVVTETNKVAASPMLVWAKSLPTGSFSFALMHYHITCINVGGAWEHGITHDQVSIISSAVSYGAAINMGYGVIDGTYYDQFSNLPNYV